jgi:hypothetical protein
MIYSKRRTSERTGRALTPLLQGSLVRIDTTIRKTRKHVRVYTQLHGQHTIYGPQCTGSRLPRPPRITGFTLNHPLFLWRGLSRSKSPPAPSSGPLRAHAPPTRPHPAHIAYHKRGRAGKVIRSRRPRRASQPSLHSAQVPT